MKSMAKQLKTIRFWNICNVCPEIPGGCSISQQTVLLTMYKYKGGGGGGIIEIGLIVFLNKIEVVRNRSITSIRKLHFYFEFRKRVKLSKRNKRGQEKMF